MGESVFSVEVNAVGRDILRYEHKLLDALLGESFRLLDYALLVAAAEGSADRRDSAVGAAVRAALGYLEICPIVGGGEHTLAAHGKLLFVGEHVDLLAVENLVDYLGDITVCADAYDGVDLGNLL